MEYMEYYEFYIMGIILLPAIIFSIIAQAKVNDAYKRNSAVNTQSGLPDCKVAEMILQQNDIIDVQVIKIGGKLTDYYSDKDKQIALSEDIYNSSSVAAIGIAMHEVGHAIQYAKDYRPVKIRNFMVKVCNLSSKILWPLVILGLIFNLGVSGGGVLGEVFL